MEQKNDAVAVMQEYFPSGGRDYDHICALFDAIAEGKIPHLNYTSKADELESAVKPVMKYLAENHHPHTSITVTSNSAELLESVQCVATDEYLKD